LDAAGGGEQVPGATNASKAADSRDAGGPSVAVVTGGALDALRATVRGVDLDVDALGASGVKDVVEGGVAGEDTGGAVSTGDPSTVGNLAVGLGTVDTLASAHAVDGDEFGNATHDTATRVPVTLVGTVGVVEPSGVGLGESPAATVTVTSGRRKSAGALLEVGGGVNGLGGESTLLVLVGPLLLTLDGKRLAEVATSTGQNSTLGTSESTLSESRVDVTGNSIQVSFGLHAGKDRGDSEEHEHRGELEGNHLC